jgi:iron complex transport system substrate-binding protein
MHAELDSLHQSVVGKPRPTVLFVVYNNPPMTAGPKTFIGQLISYVGGTSISDDASTLWPNVSIEELVRRQPDIVVIPVGEFKSNSLARFRATPGWRDLTALKEGHVLLIDADLATRPGPRIVESARLLRDAFHPELASPAAPAARAARVSQASTGQP